MAIALGSELMLRRILVIGASLCWATTAGGQSDELARVTLVGGAGLGGGAKELGPIHVLAVLESQVWFNRHMGLGGSALVHASGAPDSRGANGQFYGLGFALRSANVPDTPYGYLSLEPGLLHNSGYDHPHHQDETSFDHYRVGWSVRGGALSRWKALAGGAELRVYGDLKGSLAVVPMLVGGVEL